MPFVLLYHGADICGIDTNIKLMNLDAKAAGDVVLVMGTSLAIEAVRDLIRRLQKKNTLVIYVNRRPPGHGMDAFFSHYLQGEVSAWASILSSALHQVNPVTCAGDQTTPQGGSDGQKGMWSGRSVIGDALSLAVIR